MFKATIEHINEIFDRAEALSCRTVTEGCFSCLTGYALHYCFKTYYERVSIHYRFVYALLLFTLKGSIHSSDLAYMCLHTCITQQFPVYTTQHFPVYKTQQVSSGTCNPFSFILPPPLVVC